MVRKILSASVLGLFSFFVACTPKVWKADDFESGARSDDRPAAFFGRIIPQVKFGKVPACRVTFSPLEEELNTDTYELPSDGMVYFWGKQGRMAIRSIACFRDKNWMPKVAFTEKVPAFQNAGGSHVTYFGTLTVSIRDADELPTRRDHPYFTDYIISEETEEAVNTLIDHFPVARDLKVEKHVLVPTAEP